MKFTHEIIRIIIGYKNENENTTLISFQLAIWLVHINSAYVLGMVSLGVSLIVWSIVLIGVSSGVFITVSSGVFIGDSSGVFIRVSSGVFIRVSSWVFIGVSLRVLNGVSIRVFAWVAVLDGNIVWVLANVAIIDGKRGISALQWRELKNCNW